MTQYLVIFQAVEINFCDENTAKCQKMDFLSLLIIDILYFTLYDLYLQYTI